MVKINPKIKTKIISVDFSVGTSPQFYNAIVNNIKDEDVSILVNNVGILNLGVFDKIENKELMRELIVNTMPTAMLTKRFVPKMLARKNKSAIINLSSKSIDVCLPHNCVYSATKAYDDMFSRSVGQEH